MNSTPTTEFTEDRAAAQSQKSAWTRMASTYSLIRVELRDRTLHVEPRSTIARWMVQGLGLDLAHRIPVDRILSAEHEGDWGRYGKVMLAFNTAGGQEQRLRLYLVGWRELIGALVAQGVAVRG